jgi:hypothetical protein
MLRSLNDLSRFDALCAYLHAAVAATRELDANRLKIRVKASSGLVISV